jgi:cytochrome P450
MHAPLIHHSPVVYPEPHAFIPERWLSPTSTKHPYLPSRPPGIPQANPKYLMAFSKGTKHCLGQPLAYAELCMTLANVLRIFVRLERAADGAVTGVKGMKLWETDKRDT